MDFLLEDGLQNELSRLIYALDNCCERFEAADMRLKQFDCLLQKKSELAFQEDNDRIAELRKNLTTVETCIKIAKAHISPHGLLAPTAEKPFDKITLEKLQVLIDNRSRNDSAAESLYIEAISQRNYIMAKISALELAFQNARQCRLDDNDLQQVNSLRQICQQASDEYVSLIAASPLVKGSSANIMSPQVASNMRHAKTGSIDISLPTPGQMNEEIKSLNSKYSNVHINTNNIILRLDAYFELGKGGSILIECSGHPDECVYSGIQSMLLNVLLGADGAVQNVTYLDPINLSSTNLGVLARYCGRDSSVFRAVPTTISEIKNTLFAFDAVLSRDSSTATNNYGDAPVDKVLVVDGFPNEYDRQALAVIRKLCFNSRRYGLIVILISRAAGLYGASGEMFESIKEKSLHLSVNKGDNSARIVNSDFDGFVFRFLPAPTEPLLFAAESVLDRISNISENNTYINFIENNRPGLNLPHKGSRTLCNIAIGIDEKGSPVYISFENELFATYICGATRSGKSTLLHTILTEVMLTKHPDDLEVWLVDFKMTEFARYADNILPHIKYIILDESPELVYDLIDKLITYLNWRQRVFKKNGWVKLSDAEAAGEYMPAVLVVIDEFSVMSRIVAEATSAGRDYKEKLQYLLSKGASFGFRFILSSQGFTQGTKGLSEYSKMQIQQRIAMKTNYEEIKATLDLPSVSEGDRIEMEELDAHYALLKVPYGQSVEGSRLKKAHVLFFQSVSDQMNLFSFITDGFSPSEQYDRNSERLYRAKNPIVIDGNTRKDYASVKQIIDKGAASWNSFDTSALLMSIGEPKRMRNYCPIELVDASKENVLLFAGVSNGESVQSILATVLKSLEPQSVDMHICLSRSNRYLRGLSGKLPYAALHIDAEEVCPFIQNVKMGIEKGVHSRSLLVFFDIDKLSDEMETGSPHNVFAAAMNNQSGDRPAIVSALRNGDEEERRQFVAEFNSGSETDDQGVISKNKVYDARADIGFVVAQGPRFGYHVLVVTDDISNLNYIYTNILYFKHIIYFQSLRGQLAGLIPRYEAPEFGESDSSSFRYVCGKEGTTFRPYEHIDLGILTVSNDDLDNQFFSF
ncbi:FtsK/SpoIIIE domain-containing protein [Collinsella ihumii]|nr:FtsK/SpoIIIE domain-containing protein [Collinsella ihumii]